MEDSLLWVKFKQGDDDTFSQLYIKYIDQLYRYGMKFIRDEDVVKDCIHDLYIKIYQNRQKLPDVNNPLLYLFISLKNSIVDKLRRDNKNLISPLKDPEFYVDFYLEQDDDLYEDAVDLENKFKEVMNILSSRQKEAIYLRYQLEMSYDEIALLLGINAQSARNLTHRAVEKVRSKLSLTTFLFFFLFNL